MQVAVGESLQEQIHRPLAPDGNMVDKISTYGKEISLRYSSSSCSTNQGAPDVLCSRPTMKRERGSLLKNPRNLCQNKT